MTILEAIEILNIEDYTHIVTRRKISAGSYEYIKGGKAFVFKNEKYGGLEVICTFVAENAIFFQVL